MHIYLDDPEDEVFEHLNSLKGCFVTRCTDEYWSQFPDGERPEGHRGRQNQNSQHCYDSASADWLFHLDADEFIYEIDSLVDELTALPDDIDCLNLVVFERGYLDGMNLKTIFSGVFKKQLGLKQFLDFPGPVSLSVKVRRLIQRYGRRFRMLPRLTDRKAKNSLVRRLFGDDAKKAGKGFTGHSAGKSATRCGKNHLIGIHYPRINNPTERISMPNRRSKAAFMIHFDGLTRLGWVSKRVRIVYLKSRFPKRGTAPQIMAQARSLLNNSNHPDHPNKLHQRLQWMNPHQEKLMRAHNYLLDLDFDTDSALRYIGPDIPIDLSPKAFDEWLWKSKGPLLNEYGFEKGPELRRKAD